MFFGINDFYTHTYGVSYRDTLVTSARDGDDGAGWWPGDSWWGFPELNIVVLEPPVRCYT